MERDFLGISRKDSGGFSKDDGRSGHPDSASVGGSVAQWPFSNKVSAMHHLMSFKTVPEGEPKITAYDHLSSPMATKGAYETSYRASSVKEVPQRCFSLDRQSARQFSVHAYQHQSTDIFGAANGHVVSHPSIPVSMSSPFFKVHGSSNVPNLPATSLRQHPLGGFAANNPTLVGSTSGHFNSRNISKTAASAQLTIFYAGSVNVFDDVPLAKAQSIMFMASKACGSTSNAPNPRPETTVSSPIPKIAAVTGLNANHSMAQIQTQTHTHTPAIPVTSHIGAQSRSSSSTANDVSGSKNDGPLPPALSQHEPSNVTNSSAPILTRAVPQARKASLARFLEKRKERVTNTMPYPCAKQSPENLTGFEGGNVSSKCSSADLSISSNREESWRSVQPKGSAGNMDSPPSTELQM